ncbi:uncharacterized protein cubi_00830, partial [Cryptosporidium ubiquitum]
MFELLNRKFLFPIGLLLINLIIILASDVDQQETWVSPENQYDYDEVNNAIATDEGTSNINRKVAESQNHNHRHNYHHKSHHNYRYYNTYYNQYAPKHIGTTDDEGNYISDHFTYVPESSHHYHYNNHHKNVYQMGWSSH